MCPATITGKSRLLAIFFVSFSLIACSSGSAQTFDETILFIVKGNKHHPKLQNDVAPKYGLPSLTEIEIKQSSCAFTERKTSKSQKFLSAYEISSSSTDNDGMLENFGLCKRDAGGARQCSKTEMVKYTVSSLDVQHIYLNNIDVERMRVNRSTREIELVANLDDGLDARCTERKLNNIYTVPSGSWCYPIGVPWQPRPIGSQCDNNNVPVIRNCSDRYVVQSSSQVELERKIEAIKHLYGKFCSGSRLKGRF